MIFPACFYLPIAQDLDQHRAHNNLWLVCTLSVQDRDETAQKSLLPTICPTIYVSDQCTEGKRKISQAPMYVLAPADGLRHNRFKNCIHQSLFVLLNCMLCNVQKFYAWCSCWIVTSIALISHCLLRNHSHLWWASYNDESYNSFFFMLRLSNIHKAGWFCFKKGKWVWVAAQLLPLPLLLNFLTT